MSAVKHRSIPELVKTMPWDWRAGMPGIPGNVEVLDRHGKVVPLFDVLNWVAYSSKSAAAKAATASS